MIIVVIDTCVLRRAYEKSIKIDDESQKAYGFIAGLLQRKDVIFVANSKTQEEYYNHLESLRNKLRRLRVYPQSFGILRALMPE